MEAIAKGSKPSDTQMKVVHSKAKYLMAQLKASLSAKSKKAF